MGRWSFSFEASLSISKRTISFNRRLFYALVACLIILIVLVPVVVYWSEQRIAEHARWDTELNYARLFSENVGSAAEFINATFYPWNNESERSALTLLVQSETTLFMIGDLDMAHANQLAIIGNKVGESPSAFYQITQTQRVSFSTHLRALGDKILYAYYLNNTSTSNGVGPSFWYSGPSPPNEKDLQDASTIAANLTG